MHCLNLYDYSARYYEGALGRFTSVDPLAEKFYSWSPYVYTFNNPLRFTDPTGMSPDDGLWNELKKILKQAASDILTVAGLSGEQIQSDDPAVLEDASQRRQKTAEIIHTVNETVASVVPGGDVAYNLANDREVSAEDAVGAAAEVASAPLGKVVKGAKVVAKVVDKAGDVSKAAKKGKTTTSIGDKFTKTTKIVPGKGGGQSRAEYVVTKNKEGKTIRTYKDSYDRANKFQHRKPLRGGPEGRPQ